MPIDIEPHHSPLSGTKTNSMCETESYPKFNSTNVSVSSAFFVPDLQLSQPEDLLQLTWSKYSAKISFHVKRDNMPTPAISYWISRASVLELTTEEVLRESDTWLMTSFNRSMSCRLQHRYSDDFIQSEYRLRYPDFQKIKLEIDLKTPPTTLQLVAFEGRPDSDGGINGFMPTALLFLGASAL